MMSTYKKDPRAASIELSRAYYLMGYTFRHQIKNNRAAIACKPIEWLYFFGMHRVAQLVHNCVLRPVVAQHEWGLLRMYGERYRLL